MPIQILWGNDLSAQNTFIQELIDKEVSKEWREINVTNLNAVSYTHLTLPTIPQV